MNHWERHAAALRPQREQLLDAAIAEFAARGFEATSMPAIASAAGVSRAAVFDSFDSFDSFDDESAPAARAPSSTG